MADSIINEEIVNDNESVNQMEAVENETFSVDKIEADNNIVGKILIEKINVNAPVMDGVDQETLKVSVGHFSNTGYWTRKCMPSIT